MKRRHHNSNDNLVQSCRSRLRPLRCRWNKRSTACVSKMPRWRQVSGPPIANDHDRPGDGSAFNDFIRRSAQWPKTISGWDPRTEAPKYEPYLPLRNVTPEFPPTFLIHGEKDTDVPATQPQAMLAELTRNGVESKLILLPDSEHGFRGGDTAVTAAARAEAVQFILKHL